ncbi:hypothetical protein B0H14DRAFT_3865534 [Mycena olivaceomarginata]|nr:hypothetical protein B0H14DRAFT_3865534 [Mycena olivaceomarginata]
MPTSLIQRGARLRGRTTTQTCADAESASAQCGFVRLLRRAGLEVRLTSSARRGFVRTAVRRRIRPPRRRTQLPRLRPCGVRDAVVALGVDGAHPGRLHDSRGLDAARAAPPTRGARRTRSPPRVSGLARRADAALPASIPTCPRVDSPPRGTPPDSRSAFCAHSIPARLGLLHDSCGLVRARPPPARRSRLAATQEASRLGERSAHSIPHCASWASARPRRVRTPLCPRVAPGWPPRKTLPDLGSVLRALDPTLRITGGCTTRARAHSTPPARRSLPGERVLRTLDRIPPPSARIDSQRPSSTRPGRHTGSRTETTTPPTRNAPQSGTVRICDVSKPPACSRYRDRKCAHLTRAVFRS